jgi:hypothetical protein
MLPFVTDRESDLDGLEPEIEGWGSEKFAEWTCLWQRICDPYGEDPNVPVNVAEELASTFANQVGEYIENFAEDFPRGAEVTAIKCIIYGLFLAYMYADTDDVDTSTPRDSE